MTPEKAKHLLGVMQAIYKSSSQLLEHELSGMFEFTQHHHPNKTFSDEVPPIRLGEKADIIPIDGLLGLYSPDNEKIIIFNKGIQKVSDLLKIKKEQLEQIVRLHEWAHANFHEKLTLDTPCGSTGRKGFKYVGILV